MYGIGLLKGLSVTLKRLLSGKITQEYPDEYPELPPTFCGSFKLDVTECVGCLLCIRNCPNSVISLETFKDEDNNRRLSKFKMDLTYCQFCGFCVEACPKQALKFSQEFEMSTYNKEDLTLDLLEKAEEKQEKEKEKGEESAAGKQRRAI